MKLSQDIVSSHSRDEVCSTNLDQIKRDVCYGTVLEIRGERWFQIESCSHSSGEAEIKTFIVKDFPSARALVCQLRDCTWTCLRLYTRAPLLRPEGFVFEAIDKVFELKTGALLFVLESGAAFSESKFGLLGAEPLQDAKEIYLRR